MAGDGVTTLQGELLDIVRRDRRRRSRGKAFGKFGYWWSVLVVGLLRGAFSQAASSKESDR